MAAAADRDTERLAKYLLLSAPPGEYEAVATHVAALLGGAAEDALMATAREYALRHASPLRLPSNNREFCLLTVEGCAAGGGFVLHSEAGSGALACVAGAAVQPEVLAPAATAVLLARSAWPPAVEAAAAAAATPALEPLRAATHRLLLARVLRGGSGGPAGAKALLSRGAEVWAPAVHRNAPALILYASAVIADAANCVSGELRSRWVLALGNDGAGQLEGSLALSSHVYEGGNFALRDARRIGPLAVAATSSGGGGGGHEALAAAAVAAVAAAEDAFLEVIDAAYDGLSMAVLKDMRRVLPLGGRKYDWHAVGQQRVVHALITKAAAPTLPPPLKQ